MTKNNILHENILPSEYTNVNFCTYIDNGTYTPSHWHRAIELVYMLEGKVLRTVEGKTWTISVGRCLLTNSNVVHSDRSMEYSRYILLHIPLDFLEKFIPDARYIRFKLDFNETNTTKIKQINMVKKMLTAMKALQDKKEKGYLLKFNSILFDLLHLLYTNFSTKSFQAELKPQQKDFDRLDKVLQYIMKNYARPISLEEISGILVFRPEYFCRFFKKYMGITFLEYQNELRLSFIYRDIIETTEPIGRILEKHGFTNYKIFRRMFNEHFGTTPMKIRQQHSAK